MNLPIAKTVSWLIIDIQRSFSVRSMDAGLQIAQHIEEDALCAQPPATQTVISGTANPATVPAGAQSTVTGAVTDPTGAGTPTGAVSLNVSLHMLSGLFHACENILDSTAQ